MTAPKIVLLPYEITLLSNKVLYSVDVFGVLLPYEITLLSNPLYDEENGALFYYLMKLHYSQTAPCSRLHLMRFYYLMKLHYSQTNDGGISGMV